MVEPIHPFAVPERLPPPFKDVFNYWKQLIRGRNEMPFWDDVNLAKLPELADRLMFVDVYEDPQRFRLNTLGQKIQKLYGANLIRKFTDEIEPKPPFEFFAAQASATVEASAPTLLKLGSRSRKKQEKVSYRRLLLPMWGNGRIEALLGLIV